MVNKLKKNISITGIIIIIICIIAAVSLFILPNTDKLEYEGKTYSCLEYPADIFYYDLKACMEFDIDEIYSIDAGEWDMIYHSGDVYCCRGDYREASRYYNNHENYDWFVVIETEDEENIYPVSLLEEDFEYIQHIEDEEKEISIFFDEIENMGSLIKVSKDGVIQGTTSLAEYKGEWYWRTEIINENREQNGEWPEYIIKLPDELNRSINGAEENQK